jgi:hypothetical protein
MPHTILKPAIAVTVDVRWEGGDRTFNLALTHEAILASRTGDTLLANTLREKIKVPFLHWRRLEVQLAHIWSTGQGQVIYSHSSDEDHRTSQEQVIEILSLWQQHACLEPRSMRMILTLDIDPAGVHLLPPRPKLLSLTQDLPKTPTETDSLTSSPKGALKAPVTPEKETDKTFKTIVYKTGLDIDKNQTSQHIHFDRVQGAWSRVVLSR